MDRRRPIFFDKICPNKEFPFHLFREGLDLRTCKRAILIENFFSALLNGLVDCLNRTFTIAKVIKATISFAIYASFFTRESVSSTSILRIAAFEEKKNFFSVTENKQNKNAFHVFKNPYRLTITLYIQSQY